MLYLIVQLVAGVSHRDLYTINLWINKFLLFLCKMSISSKHWSLMLCSILPSIVFRCFAQIQMLSFTNIGLHENKNLQRFLFQLTVFVCTYYWMIFILTFCRLTTDVQEFKSSFKQTVSGGLRAATQIIGCSVSLIMISPEMTFITLLCVPSIVAVGTLIGSLLRATSRRAQAQVRSPHNFLLL